MGMRKTLLLSSALLSAVSTFATVKNVTIPVVPEGKNCRFVIKDIPGNLDVTEEQNQALNSLVGKTFEENTFFYVLTDSLENGTLKF